MTAPCTQCDPARHTGYRQIAATYATMGFTSKQMRSPELAPLVVRPVRSVRSSVLAGLGEDMSTCKRRAASTSCGAAEPYRMEGLPCAPHDTHRRLAYDLSALALGPPRSLRRQLGTRAQRDGVQRNLRRTRPQPMPVHSPGHSPSLCTAHPGSTRLPSLWGHMVARPFCFNRSTAAERSTRTPVRLSAASSK